MVSLMKLPKVLRFVWDHPLSRRRRFARLRRFVAWQIGARLVPGPVVVPFVNNTRLLVRPGMEGATGNVYAGLHEFDEMAFVLHCLRTEDLFVDVGANVGTYTLLAASVVGCRCISVEPVARAFSHLIDNLHLNGIERLVEAHCLALGAASGQVQITNSRDTMNRVVTQNDHDKNGSTTTVTMTTLDKLVGGRGPTILKIDVEGFERQVIAGGQQTLREPSLLAIILETNQNAARGSSHLQCLDNEMRALGYQPYHYDGIARRLAPSMATQALATNTVYARSIDALLERCGGAPRFRVLDMEV
jgi:FkbM family methyltransferase